MYSNNKKSNVKIKNLRYIVKNWIWLQWSLGKSFVRGGHYVKFELECEVSIIHYHTVHGGDFWVTCSAQLPSSVYTCTS